MAEAEYSDIDDPNEFDDSDNDLDEDSYSEDDKKSEPKTCGNGVDYCCKHRCLTVFDDDFKKRLISDLSLLDKSAMDVYLFAMMSIKEKKKRCGKVVKSSFQYAIKEYGVMRYVCKTAFIVLHGITLGLVRTLRTKMATNHLIPFDHRGRHENRQSIPTETQDQIKIHFFETINSPKIFKCTKKNIGEPNFYKLWLDFTRKHGSNLSRTTYVKYICSILTPEIRQKFMSANTILNKVNEKKKKKVHRKTVDVDC